jgi:NAD(P)-dependent dehydrogenase (short-subunit alcohol dehydrogenase family)
VTDPDSVNQVAAAVKEMLGEQRLFGLVNNAGIAVLGPLACLPLERFRQQIEVNLLGVHTVTQAFLPLLGTEPNRVGEPRRVVTISSIHGKLAMSFAGELICRVFDHPQATSSLHAGTSSTGRMEHTPPATNRAPRLLHRKVFPAALVDGSGHKGLNTKLFSKPTGKRVLTHTFSCLG